MSHWDIHQHEIVLDKFRGKDQYLSSPDTFDGMVEYIKSIGREEWLDICGEDDAFGCPVQNINGRIVSRDLTDSITEIDWLTRNMPTDGTWSNILDIGAGYGRLAHRLKAIYPEKKITCTDGIPVSFKVCEQYLAYRNIQVPIVLPENLPSEPQFDLAINIHSWPECKMSEINWWLDWLVANKVPYLFVVPHHDHMDREMLSAENQSFKPSILDHGYEQIAYWYGPECYKNDYYLFKRKGQ